MTNYVSISEGLEYYSTDAGVTRSICVFKFLIQLQFLFGNLEKFSFRAQISPYIISELRGVGSSSGCSGIDFTKLILESMKWP